MVSYLNAVGERYGNFSLTKILPITELQATLRELVHEPTGALVMHLENDDPENLFCLSFKTLPTSSNGVPHILEHTVLCGSKKFPIKDPFFAMSRRSLNTFMNALTGADYTCYPASSQVEKDFYNLLDVYLDAVFHPELKELSFLQEGHRLEFSQPDNPKTPLEYKGIVFNEMKGSLSSPDNRLWHAMMELVVPNLPYAFNSGGDPDVIPNLSYQELVSFHRTYYHPSRCLFFFYGDLPLNKHLDFIEKEALQGVEKAPPLPPIPKQPRFLAPVMKEMSYPIQESEEEEKAIISFGWLTAPLTDQEEILALSVLDSALMDTDASLLKFPILESKYCIQADSLLDTDMSEAPYLIVCKGCKKENADKLQETIFSAIEDIIKKGIPAHLIESAIHQIELSRLEIVGDHSPFGLTLFMRSALAKQHECPPENALMVHKLFEDLLLKIKDPRYLPSLLKKYILDNPHFVRLVMVPDPKLAQEEMAKEKEKLKKIKEALTEKETKHILEQAEKLKRYQQETEAQSLECLPKVALSDIPPNPRDFPLVREQVRNLEVFHHSCFTNKIVYTDLIFDLPQVEEEDIPLIHVFTTMLAEVGCASRDYAENLEYIHAHTGGLGATCALYVQVQDPNLAVPSLQIRGKALARKADKLFALIKDVATSVRFDEKKRIKEIILQIQNSLQNRLNRNALRYAMQTALSGFSVPSKINNEWEGLPYYKAIQKMAKNLDKNLPKIIEKFLFLKDTLLCLEKPQLVLTCDEETYQEIKKNEFYGLADLPSKSFTPWKGEYPVELVESQAYVISSPVSFNATAYKTINYIHPHSPALTVSTPLLDNKILHPKIREQGGAYGCGASFSFIYGSYTFHSYRDPHIAKTLEVFDEAISTIAKGQIDDREIEEAKFGVIQQFDTPIAPGNRAITAYSWRKTGRTLEMRQNFREKLLALTPKQVQKAVEEELFFKKGVTVSFANKELLEKENVALEKLNRKLPVFSI